MAKHGPPENIESRVDPPSSSQKNVFPIVPWQCHPFFPPEQRIKGELPSFGKTFVSHDFPECVTNTLSPSPRIARQIDRFFIMS
jgi:hypothetical protein